MPQPAPTSIEDYINAFPPDVRPILQRVRQTIHEAVPEASETISYAIPTFDLQGKHLISFAGWKRHASVYPLPAGDAAFQRAIAPYKRGKGSIQFPYQPGVPYDLVGTIARLLLAEKRGVEQ